MPWSIVYNRSRPLYTLCLDQMRLLSTDNGSILQLDDLAMIYWDGRGAIKITICKCYSWRMRSAARFATVDDSSTAKVACVRSMGRPWHGAANSHRCPDERRRRA